MELSIAEFASFNLKSKSQILSYKAHLIGCCNADELNLQLYGMSGKYYIKQVLKATGKTIKIEPVLNSDALMLFIPDTDVGNYFLD